MVCGLVLVSGCMDLVLVAEFWVLSVRLRVVCWLGLRVLVCVGLRCGVCGIWLDGVVFLVVRGWVVFA